MKAGNLVTAVIGVIVRVVIAAALVSFIYRGAIICYNYGYRILTEPAMSAGEGRTVTITYTSDMSAFELGKMMEQKGLSRDGKLFALQYYFSEVREDIRPGTYEVSTAMTAEEILTAMVPVAVGEPTDE